MLNITAISDTPDVFFESTQFLSNPAWTLLYPLEPHGIGTGECESLTSYICRLADKHRVPPRILLKEELFAKLVARNSFWRHKSSEFGNKHADVHFISSGETTKNLVDVLCEATGVNSLSFCTMLPLRNILGAGGLYAKKQRYCPHCVRVSKDPYELFGQLLWDFGCIKACPIHGVQLVELGCGAPVDKHLNMYNRKKLWGVCSCCGNIGYQCRKEAPLMASDEDIWKAQQVAELISCFPNSSKIFSRKTIIDGLRSIISKADGNNAIIARQAGLYKSVLWGWVHGNYPANLGPLLNICITAGVSLASVMKGDPATCVVPYCTTKKLKKRPTKPSRKEREYALDEALAANPPISLTCLAQKLKLDRSILRRQFPEKTSLLVDRYRIFELSERDNREKSSIRFVRGIVEKLKIQGRPLTNRNFCEVSGKVLITGNRLHRALKKIAELPEI